MCGDNRGAAVTGVSVSVVGGGWKIAIGQLTIYEIMAIGHLHRKMVWRQT